MRLRARGARACRRRSGPAWNRGQRGWKTQAAGGATGEGTSPPSTIRVRDGPVGRRRLPRHRRQERRRVRVLRMLVDRLAVAELDDAAEVHDGDPVGDLPDHGQVVRDEDEGQVEVGLEAPQQVQDLRLDRDVERRDRLVAHDQLRLQRKGARDADSLPLAARELVRVAVVVLGAQPDALEQLADPRLRVTRRLVDRVRRPDDLADGLARVQRRVRDPGRSSASRGAAGGGDAATLCEMSCPSKRIVPEVGVEQPQDQARGRRLAATRTRRRCRASRPAAR